jgi:hypothetical protein
VFEDEFDSLRRLGKKLTGKSLVPSFAKGRVRSEKRKRRSNGERALVLFENLQFLQPSHEGMRRGVRLFFALRVLHLVQDFIALVDPRPGFLFARKARRVIEVADDPPILEMQFGREIKLDRHAAETPARAGGSREKLPASEESILARMVRPASNISEFAESDDKVR